MKIESVDDLQPDCVSNIMQIYNKILVQYNMISTKDIPYRSEAIADFLQATILDEIHTFFIDIDLVFQSHFQKQSMILQEQEGKNARLESLVQTSADKLQFIGSQ